MEGMDSSFTAQLVMENGRRSIGRFLEPLLSLAGVQADFLGSFEVGREKYSLPRFTFRGPNSSDPIRIGVFAAIHGDEPAGALAAARFLLDLATEPALAENFHLQVYPIYPICNPTGFEDNTRQSRRGGQSHLRKDKVERQSLLAAVLHFWSRRPKDTLPLQHS